MYVVNGYTALIVKSIDKDYWVEPDSESMSPEGGGGEGSSSGGAPYYVPATVIMSAAADDNQIVIGKYDSATGHNAVTIDLQNNYENNYFNGTAKTAEQLKDSSEITGVVKTGFGSYIGEATASSSSSSSSPRHNGYYFIGQKLVQTASDKLYLLPGTVFTTNIEQYCSTSTMDVMLSSYLRKGGIYLVTSDAESGSGDSYMTGKYAVLCCIDTGTHQPYSSTLHSFEHENVKFIVLAAPISYYNEHPITSSYSYYIYPIEYYYTDTFAGSSIRRIVTTAVE